MLTFILRRVVALVPVLVGVSLVVFFFLRLVPGDPAVVMLGERANAENVARVRTLLGLDEPLHIQYLRYMQRVLRGDLGVSIHTSNPITAELAQRFPATVELTVSALLIALIVGVPAGILSATRRNSLIDGASMLLAIFGVSIPIFWLGLMLVWVFAIQLKWLPPGGRLDVNLKLAGPTGFFVVDSLLSGNWTVFVTVLKHLTLPSVALATVPMAIVARMTRSSMLEVLRQDYMRTAMAKGLPERTRIWRHAIKNAFLPVVTVIGLQVGLLLSGAVLTESIFSWPGIGRWIYDSIILRDYPVVQSMALVIAFIFVFANLAVDVTYALLDPRIRYS